jgi:hypothetical protein
MATEKEPMLAELKPPVITPPTLQQKFVKLREAVPAIQQKQHSSGVAYKFAKIFDIYELLTPAMNQFGVNFDIVAEKATRHAENGDAMFYHSYQQSTRNGQRTVWVYEADLTFRWTNADDPNDTQEVTLHAIGTNDGGPDKAKGSAWTYCLKYYLFEKFGIDQGEDDPDNKDLRGDAPQYGQQQDRTPQNASGNITTIPKGQSGQNGQAGGQKALSEAQMKRLYAKAEAAGMSREKTDQRILKVYGQSNPNQLTKTQYDEICNALDAAATKPKEEQQNAE